MTIKKKGSRRADVVKLMHTCSPKICVFYVYTLYWREKTTKGVSRNIVSFFHSFCQMEFPESLSGSVRLPKGNRNVHFQGCVHSYSLDLLPFDFFSLCSLPFKSFGIFSVQIRERITWHMGFFSFFVDLYDGVTVSINSSIGRKNRCGLVKGMKTLRRWNVMSDDHVLHRPTLG